jgi:hypothetical protein
LHGHLRDPLTHGARADHTDLLEKGSHIRGIMADNAFRTAVLSLSLQGGERVWRCVSQPKESSA